MTKRLSVLLPLLLCVAALTASAATVRVRVTRTPLRAAANSSAAIVEYLDAGTLLELIDVDRDWYKVRNPATKKEGFVLGSLVDLEPGSLPPAAKPGAPGATTTSPQAAGKKPVVPPKPPKKGDWTDVGYLWVNGLYQVGASEVRQQQSWTYFAETASFSATVPGKNAAGFGIDAGFRVWRNLAVGAGLSYVSRSSTAQVTGSLPNPIYLNRARSFSTQTAWNNAETGLHLDAAWVVPMPPKSRLTVFAGPSLINIKQTIIKAQGIETTSSAYPYDSSVDVTAATSDLSKLGIGFNAGVDFTYFLGKTVGVGGGIRFTRASAKFAVDGQDSVSVDAGGVQAIVGLRVRFPGNPKATPAPPKKPETKVKDEKKDEKKKDDKKKDEKKKK